MTATSLGAPTAPRADPAATKGAGPDHREGPGSLRVDPRVVRKLAAAAANEVEGVSRGSVGPIGRAIHHPVPASTPADQLGIDLDLTVSVDYPKPLRVVVERLAAHLSRRVEELTGRPVRRLSVHVEHLGASSVTERPRVR